MEPRNTKDFFHNATAIAKVMAWFTEWTTTSLQVLWVYGPPGCGKSTAVRLAAAECNVQFQSEPPGLLLSQLGLVAKPMGTRKMCVVIRDGDQPVLPEIDYRESHVIVLSHARLSAAGLKTIKGSVSSSVKITVNTIAFSRPTIDDVVAFLKRDVLPPGNSPTIKELRCIVRNLHCDIRRIGEYLDFFRDHYVSPAGEPTQPNGRRQRRRKNGCGMTATPLEALASRMESRSQFDAVFPYGHVLRDEYKMLMQ